MFCTKVTPLTARLTTSPGTAASTLPVSVVWVESVVTPLIVFEVMSAALGVIVGVTWSTVKPMLALSVAMLPAAS